MTDQQTRSAEPARPTANVLTPKEVDGLAGVIAVAAGEHHALALMEDGTVIAWGDAYEGELGNGTLGEGYEDKYRWTPQPVTGLSDVRAVAAGEGGSLALRGDGSVWRWGRGQATPVRVPGLHDVQAISDGFRHSLALMGDGTVRAWGWNRFGQLGNGEITDAEEHIEAPVEVVDLADVTAVAAGAAYSLAVRGDGTLMAWGANHQGMVLPDHPADQPILSPTPVAGLT